MRPELCAVGRPTADISGCLCSPLCCIRCAVTIPTSVASRARVARRGNWHRPRCFHCDPRSCRTCGRSRRRSARRHTLTLCACSLVAAVTGLGYVMIQGFAGLLLVALVQAAMLAPIVPLSDALATTAARMSESGQGRRFEYGWLRASGSAAFIVGTMLSGWAASGNGLASIVWFSGTLLGVGGVAAFCFPRFR